MYILPRTAKLKKYELYKYKSVICHGPLGSCICFFKRSISSTDLMHSEQFWFHSMYTFLKKVNSFPVPNRDNNNNYSRPGRVCLVTSRLGTGNSLNFFLQCSGSIKLTHKRADWWVLPGVAPPLHLLAVPHRLIQTVDQAHTFSAKKYVKGTVPRDFQLEVFYMHQFSPKPLIRLRPFRFFSKIRGDIPSTRCTASIVDTRGNFATDINNTSGTGGKIRRRCRWYRWCTLTCEYLREFSKKIVMTLVLFSEAWGKRIHEKEIWSKNLVTLTLYGHCGLWGLHCASIIGKLSDQSTMSVSDLLFEKISRQCRTKAFIFEAINLVIAFTSQ
jgi:hypothetical protein